MSELLLLQPVFKEAIGRGTKLKERYEYEISGPARGECWAVSAHPQGDCRVCSGTYKGERLSALWSSHPELFGNEDGAMGPVFPLIVKLIDAQADLSIQVHPNDIYAGQHEHGSLGKTECWYILDCEPGASIVIGHYAKGREELVSMTEGKLWNRFIRENPIKKGDFFQINPGCIHAIKGGTLILETQQSSDITYRNCDYDRLWNGFTSCKNQRKKTETENVDREHLETCAYYTVEKYDVHGTWNHKFQGRFINVSVLEGKGGINGIGIEKGMHFIIPMEYGICEMKGIFSILCSWVPKPQLLQERKPLPENRGEQSLRQKMEISVYDWMGRRKAGETDGEQVILAFEDIYEEGDTIRLSGLHPGHHYVVRIDDTMDESLIYVTEPYLTYEVPFGEKKKSYNTKSFTGRRHYLTCRPARDYEIQGYRNLAKNVMDQHGMRGSFPHASANVETRGESVFAARNAIDGVTANRSHGSWPYESWGINKRQDAEMLLEFGCPVDCDRVVLWTRADFPHDNWWIQARLTFSDGSVETVKMEKSMGPHVFYIEKHNITWLRLDQLVQSNDPSPFPALTQIEVYGTVNPAFLLAGGECSYQD